MSKLETNTIDTVSGTSTLQVGSTNTSTITLGVSGDTVNIPSGVTIANSGTATGFGGANTPAFRAYLNGTQVIPSATGTKITFNGEVLDTDNCFDSTTNYRFTPTVAGNYVINLHTGGASYTGSAGISVKKNGSTDMYFWDGSVTGSYREGGLRILNFNGTTDYIEAYAYFGSGRTISGSSGNNYNTWFEGYKIIE